MKAYIREKLRIHFSTSSLEITCVPFNSMREGNFSPKN